MLGACVKVAPPAIVGAIVEIIAGAVFGAGVAITLTTTYPHKCIGSVRTEVMDAATSEHFRIAAAATESDKDASTSGPMRTAAEDLVKMLWCGWIEFLLPQQSASWTPQRRDTEDCCCRDS